MQRPTVIAIDEDVFAHLIEARLIQVMGALPGVRLLIPEQVDRALSHPTQRQAIERGLAADLITIGTAHEMAAIALYAAMRPRMSQGQAACLAMAQIRGMHVATDDRTVLYREAVIRLGEPRIHTTFALLARAVAEGLLTEEESAQTKAYLNLKEPRVVEVTMDPRIVYRCGDDTSTRRKVGTKPR